MPFQDAAMVELPTATPDASPLALTVATEVKELVQVAEEVMFWVVPLARVAMAENCWVACGAMVAITGVTVTAVAAAAGVTLTATEAEIEPVLAEMATLVAAETVPAVARPAALMVRAEVLLDDQVTVVVRFWVD